MFHTIKRFSQITKDFTNHSSSIQGLQDIASQIKRSRFWFDEGCCKLLDQRTQAKLQWLQDKVK
jgi:hypothetical protein